LVLSSDRLALRTRCRQLAGRNLKRALAAKCTK
jgi:hypothetical protein